MSIGDMGMLSGFIGKTISGVSASNLCSGTVESVTFEFESGEKITFSNEYMDSEGWSVIHIGFGD